MISHQGLPDWRGKERVFPAFCFDSYNKVLPKIPVHLMRTVFKAQKRPLQPTTGSSKLWVCKAMGFETTRFPICPAVGHQP